MGSKCSGGKQIQIIPVDSCGPFSCYHQKSFLCRQSFKIYIVDISQQVLSQSWLHQLEKSAKMRARAYIMERRSPVSSYPTHTVPQALCNNLSPVYAPRQLKWINGDSDLSLNLLTVTHRNHLFVRSCVLPCPVFSTGKNVGLCCASFVFHKWLNKILLHKVVTLNCHPLTCLKSV